MSVTLDLSSNRTRRCISTQGHVAGGESGKHIPVAHLVEGAGVVAGYKTGSIRGVSHRGIVFSQYGGPKLKGSLFGCEEGIGDIGDQVAELTFVRRQ